MVKKCKTKILVTSSTLKVGGVQKSLLSFLASVDYEEFDVDLLLVSKEGEWIDFLPPQVNLLDTPKYLSYCLLPKKGILKCIIELFRRFELSLLVNFMIAVFHGLFIKNMGIARQYFWKRVQKRFPSLSKNYDIAIAYSNNLPAYFIHDKVNAKTKLCWIHSDYRVMRRDTYLDNYYYSGFNYIIPVSITCSNIFKDIFPELNNKVEVIENIFSPSNIKTLAISGKGFEDDFNGVRLISVSRLDENKGFDLAVSACAKLIKDGYDIRWYIIGEGPERLSIEKLIKKFKLEKHIVLMGLKTNPYPYIKQADIFVHPSKFEGKSVAIDEAKALCKPIIVTNYTTVSDQITHNQNGFIVPISESGIYRGLKELLDDEKVRNNLTENLYKIKTGNEKEILKFYKIIEH